jgi:PAS domain S-box-containing protein
LIECALRGTTFMKDRETSREDLIQELAALRLRVAQIERLENVNEKTAAAALCQSQANYRAIFDAANDAIFVHDIGTGEILDTNEKMTILYGYTKQEVLGLRVEDLSAGTHPYTQQNAMQWIVRTAGGEPQIFEWYARRKDHSLFWVEVSLKRASIGGQERLLAVVRDITERKRAEQALRTAHDDLERRVQDRTADLVDLNEELKREILERKRVEQWLRDSERRYRTLLDEIPDVIFILDHEGRFAYLNYHVEKFLGLPVKDILDTTMESHVAQEDREKIRSLLTLDLDTIWDEEISVICGDGTFKFARIRCKPLRIEPDQPLRYEGVLRDITRRRVLEDELKASREELLEKIRIIDDLYAHIVETGKAKAIARHTAEVAHELRQPLTIIGGMAQRIVKHFEREAGDKTYGWIQISSMIISEVKRLEKILDGLIDFTRPGGLALQKRDPNEIIRRVVQAFAGVVEDKGQLVDTNFGEEAGEIILDPVRFEHVVRNLVANAIEATPEGKTWYIETGVSIPSGKAQEAGKLESEDYFEMKIRNPGAPIPQEDLENLFSPFFTTKSYGTGIGLTLSKKIVEDHKGSISVQSDGGEVVFTVWLPIRDK